MHCRGKHLNFDSHTHIMGILNCTPDSFYSESRRPNIKSAIETGLRMVEEGVDILDVGGESTRPGSKSVSIEEESKRVLPIIQELLHCVSVPISVDTTKSLVARKTLDLGAHIINDISALQFDPQMAKVVAEFSAGVILMHIKGLPQNMQKNPVYKNVVPEIKEYFLERIKFARQQGIRKEHIILDPGLGFGKRLEDNYTIINNLHKIKELGFPILLGPSRKSFIQKILDLPAEECLAGTAAIVTAGILNGAQIIRVHDVREMRYVAKVTDYLVQNNLKEFKDD